MVQELRIGVAELRGKDVYKVYKGDIALERACTR